MRKNSIFTILAVILPLTVANADEITNLTLDTPVNWSVAAFNRSIGQYCWGGGYRNVSNEIIGEFNGYRDVNADDLSDECYLFVMNYATKFGKNSAMSLRDVIDMCMSTINSGTLCANIAKSLVFYSLGHAGAI
ncbi:MAG: hypothetical protein ACLRFJ_03555, partial [Alphaproteobacteria bacterium]